MGAVYLLSDELALDVSNSMMATFYMAEMSLIYGISILWQSRD